MLKRALVEGHGLLALAMALVACAAPEALAQQSHPPAPEPPAGYGEELWQRAWKLHHEALVVDTHSDTTSRILDEGFDMGPRAKDGHADLPRIAEGGLDAQFYSIYVASRFYGDEAPLFAPPPPGGEWDRPKEPGSANGSARRALQMIDGIVRMTTKYPDRMTLCTSRVELLDAVRMGRHATLMGIEGGHAIEGRLDLLRQFHRLGVRYMTLTHTNHNEYADSCADATPRWGGLNQLGVKVVLEMNRLGMLVDVSHVSDATFFDALRVTRAPAICSHSSMRALCGHPRNITDDMLRALAKNGGVVMINFNCGFVDPEYGKRADAANQVRRIREREIRRQFAEGSKEREEAMAALDVRFPRADRPDIAVLMKHFLHAIEVAGPDHVGIGSDFDGVSCVPKGMDDVTHLPRITYHLLEAGHDEATVRKVLGANLLRVLEQAEKVAYDLRTEPPHQNDPATDAQLLQR
ncbi:MAG: hypothetical protein RIT25_2430 [Planctomycetota bacterium]